MKYLTVGTNDITYKLFRKIEDTDDSSMKPRGGLWLTEYNSKNYNDWVEFIINDPVVFYYKSRHYSMWKQPCSLVTLKDDVNLFNLSNKSDLNYLIERYPLGNQKFSYQQISDYYDGIFINMYDLLYGIKDDEIRKNIFKFGVNSLILFNLDCIDYYQSGIVSIQPFDFEYGTGEDTNYEIIYDNEKKKILKR